jgi:pimeloyl-ACP methyl ester carboxylesterase
LTEHDRAQVVEMTERHDSELADVEMVADDGITLRGWSIRPERANGEAVILLHGLSDNRIGMISYAELMVSSGYTVLLPDARAHGASQGTIATYGLLEAKEIRKWYEWFGTHEHPGCIFGFGESMGAAQLLSSLRSESGFCAVAAESPFSTFPEIAYDRVGQFFHTGPWLGRTLLLPVVEAAFAYARWHYHIDLARVSPMEAASSSQVPILLIHGMQDGNIPVRHSRAIKAHDPDLVLWEVPGADHCGAISVAPTQFREKLITWFSSHSRTKQSNTASKLR